MRGKAGRIDWTRIAFLFVFVTLLGSVAYSIVAAAQAPIHPGPGATDVKTRSDYFLGLVQCVLGLVVMFLPSMLAKRLNLAIPGLMYVLFVTFLYAGIYLGEIRDFYYRVPQWDDILHTFSGLMLAALSYSVIGLLNDTERVPLNLSPVFVALFAFSFAMAVDVLWEFYEFSVDGLFGLNSQKWALADGTPLVGRAALADTMGDLFVDAAGAALMSVTGYLAEKKKKGWFSRMAVKRTRPRAGT